ncbi:MAG: HAMP domain-containing histidine kinase [Candidatus Latescibacterota bacterium]|nr:MAG: HAMP domain-containing histidine kinase [Candidatus Latescibacterota bacterium]
MKIKESTVSELAFMFKLLPLFHEVETIDRVYRLLLGIVTSGQTVGCRRAMLLEPDEEYGVIRGRFGAEPPIRLPGEEEPGSRFEDLAKRVFKIYENIDGGDLTLKVRSYSVPIGWHRSALVKAFRSRYPVIAERRLSEFATDTFFDFFGANAYIAIPIEFDGRVQAVLAAESSRPVRNQGVDNISVLFSLVQQASATAEHLVDISAGQKKSRVLSKLQNTLNQSPRGAAFEEALRAGLAMACKSVGGSVCLVKDFAAQKTHVVEVIQDHASPAREFFKKTAAGFDEILDLSAGTTESVSSDRDHPRLTGMARDRVEYFFACPLRFGADVLGSLVVYKDKDDNPERSKDFKRGNKNFLGLCGSVIASAIGNLQQKERLRRVEDFVEEVSSHLIRERDRSRIGDRFTEYEARITDDLKLLGETLKSRKPAASRMLALRKIIESMESYTRAYGDDVRNKKTAFKMTDLFKLTRRIVESRKRQLQKSGVELTVRIPDQGPSLLLERKSIATALENILDTTASLLVDGEKMMVECSVSEDRLLVCVADNGAGVPGDTISRLFMPFVGIATNDKRKRALSVAGEVLQKHSSEIMIKSSYSWKTILVLSFPMAANRDRRKIKGERRRLRERREKPAL